MLTLEQLKAMPPGTCFAEGITTNDPQGYFVTREHPSRKMYWIAKRGEIPDWTIYCGWAEYQPGDSPFAPIGKEMILRTGDKVTNRDVIRKLVPANEDAFKMYRF